MRKAIAIRHVHFESLGNLERNLEDNGFKVSYYDVGAKNEKELHNLDADLLVILGGPIGVNDTGDYPFLNIELDVISERYAKKLPTIGICLGAQLMAKVAGAEVVQGGVKEIGWKPIYSKKNNKLFSIIDKLHVLHWHGDTFIFPDKSNIYASSDMYENQAFVIRNNYVGLQFHLEVESRNIERWLIGHANELSSSLISPERIRIDAKKYSQSLYKSANKFWKELIEQL